MVYDDTLRTEYGEQLLQTIIPMRAARSASRQGSGRACFVTPVEMLPKYVACSASLADELLALDGRA